MDAHWKMIMYLIGRRLSRELEVVPMAVDRAVVWCKDDAERNVLLKEKSLLWRNNIVERLEPKTILSLGARSD